jgi:hypothetical protein
MPVPSNTRYVARPTVARHSRQRLGLLTKTPRLAGVVSGIKEKRWILQKTWSESPGGLLLQTPVKGPQFVVCQRLRRIRLAPRRPVASHPS